MNRLNCENYLLENNSEPITEQSNELTKNIDLSKSGEEILNYLRQTDYEIFNGWRINENLKTDGLKTDLELLVKLTQIAELIRDNLSNVVIILTGCGTSGRLGYLYSQRINEYFNSTVLADYIIAGGEYALVNSVEKIEDNPELGLQELKLKLLKYETKRIVFIGITCGLSAPFVAGQLDYLISCQPNNIIATCLIGFNPVLMARDTLVINSNNETFLHLIKRMQVLENETKPFFILNPLIGPEPITGSSRMKGGTATKLILDLILTQVTQTTLNFKELIAYFEKVFELVYSKESTFRLGKLIDSSAECLRSNGSINYLSDSERLGLLCCVDASECIPTYGARREDFKGFITSSKWTSFTSNCPETQSDSILSNLNNFTSTNTLFLIVGRDEINLETLLPSAKLYYYDSIQTKELQKLLVDVETDVNKFFKDSLQEYALKLVINSISTGAHVLIGKVYENLMIDVKVSNFKLYKRAIAIIQKLTGLTQIQSELNLLKSIYETDTLTHLAIQDLDTHIREATSKSLVVPKALVIGLTQKNYEESTQLVTKSSVRNCLLQIKKL